MSEKKTVNQIATVGIVGNVLLVAFKLYAGIAGKSSAMVSDAIHSLSDVLATFIAFIGVKLAKKRPDKKHPYGHDRFECVASIVLGLILLVTGFGIGWGGVQKIITGEYRTLEMPGLIALLPLLFQLSQKKLCSNILAIMRRNLILLLLWQMLGIIVRMLFHPLAL